jgi:hypothetical protein
MKLNLRDSTELARFATLPCGHHQVQMRMCFPLTSVAVPALKQTEWRGCGRRNGRGEV